MVGAVVVKDGRVIARAFRSELNPGEHAEYTALEKKAATETLAGATIYTTLEPCTTRNHPKVPCAERLIERKIARVVIGMLDPNPAISGKGQRRLREANIVTDFFPPDLMAEVEELNRDFSRAQKTQTAVPSGAKETQAAAPERHILASIDDRIRVVSRYQFDMKWENFSETYWLVGPISLENAEAAPASLDGHLEASHSNGSLRFDVEGTLFEYWSEAMRATYQAAAAQLIFPVQIAARHKVRGICVIRFPRSELGGLGKYHEHGQKFRFVLTLTGTDLQWSFPLRLPYEWNPLPPQSLKLSR
jgi:pyrimidine deaminase RibD-like protein